MLLAAASASAMAADLELFNLKLAEASADQVRAAAIGAGARPVGPDGAIARLDVSRIGLPGARTLELTSVSGKVMTAQYYFGKDSYQTDERLRKMLLAKYGPPQKAKATFYAGDFAAQHINDGSYIWNFDGDMQMVYRKEFFGEVYLSYVNTKLLAAVERATKAQDDGKVIIETTRKNSVF